MISTPEGTVAATYGTTVRGQERSPQTSDVFRIGSVTKTMTGTVILQLADEGKLRLEDPISTFVEGVPQGDLITIADLLQMRSGIHNYLDTTGFAEIFDVSMTHIWTPDEQIELGAAEPTLFAPGSAFDYSNTNTALLGVVAEQLEGESLAEIFRERLFEPLGMDDTALPTADELDLPGSDVRGYQYGIFPINHRPLMDEADREAARQGALEPTDVSRQSPSWSWAAGGAVSTADDLMRWAEALGSGELLSDGMHRRWLDSVEPMDPQNPVNGAQYGLAIEQARFGANRLYLHEGELPGFNTIVATDPANGVRIVIWTNLALSVDGAATAKALAVDVIGQLYATPLGTPIEAE